jgi:predicted DNA repair protein MutK
MSSGLLALLDDVAVLAKAAAASLDEVVVHSAKAGTKAAGIVIDDAAVTPRYVVGFASERELLIVRRIALGSFRSKFLFLLPGALLLNALAPWLLVPLLVAGGLFLCYEGAEKILEKTGVLAHADGVGGPAGETPAEFERRTAAGAIRMDLILSAEIMAIALASVVEAGTPFHTQAAVLALVAFGITVVVCGAVAIIVKADDAGIVLARSEFPPLRSAGRLLVASMPPFLVFLSVVGTVAMLWVGGGIVLHGFESFGLSAVPLALHDAAHTAGSFLPGISSTAEWLASAMLSGAAGFILFSAGNPVLQGREEGVAGI